MNDPIVYLTAKQVCELTGVHHETLRYHRNRGHLGEVRKFGKQYAYTQANVDALLSHEDQRRVQSRKNWRDLTPLVSPVQNSEQNHADEC